MLPSVFFHGFSWELVIGLVCGAVVLAPFPVFIYELEISNFNAVGISILIYVNSAMFCLMSFHICSKHVTMLVAVSTTGCVCASRLSDIKLLALSLSLSSVIP